MALRVIVENADDLEAEAAVEIGSLKAVGIEDNLGCTTLAGFRFCGCYEPGAEPAFTPCLMHPECSDFATPAPGPAQP